MKKILTLNVKQLRTEECFGYLKQVKAETANLPNEEPPAAQTAAVNTFESAYNAFDDALKASAVNPATATVTTTDDGRDASWRGANNYLAAMCRRSRRAHGSGRSPSGGHREGNPHCRRSRLPLVGRYGKRVGDDKWRCGLRHLY